jgi:hypothetical protein
MWGSIAWQTIQYEDLGSVATNNTCTSGMGFYSWEMNWDTGEAVKAPPTPGTMHENSEYRDDCTVLGGGDPDYPFMTPENLDTSGCINNIWPCLEHICGDRYGNAHWDNPDCANQTWTASDIVEQTINGWGSWAGYYQISGDPVKKEEVQLNRSGLEYTYFYEGERAYTAIPRPEYDWNETHSAHRHFMYKRKFSITFPEESNSNSGGNK